MINLKKPNLIIIGALKSSTTLFRRLLDKHPQIWCNLHGKRNPFIFDDYNQSKSWNNYLKQFDSCPKNKKIIYDYAPVYSCISDSYASRDIPKRIKEKLGNIKLIYILRDPVERIISHYKHAFITSKKYFKSLSEALDKDSKLTTYSKYKTQLEYYYPVFGKNGVFIVIAEELHKNPKKVMSEVENYLGISQYNYGFKTLNKVNSFNELKSKIENQINKKIIEPPSISNKEKEKAFSLIKEDLINLIHILGEDRIQLWPSLTKVSKVINKDKDKKE